MKKISGYVLTMVLGIAVMLSPAASGTVYAHGHHGSGHHGSAAANYYCGGHEAHLHENGVCPYAEEEYYNCGGHEAHLHENGVCPYAEEEYYHCGGHEAHLHENGVCPYAIQGINSSDAAKSIMKFGSPIFFRLIESIGCRWRE